MSVEITSMRGEFSIQPSTADQAPAAAAQGAMDMTQLREVIREVVMEIVGDDIYSLFRLRGM